MLFKGELGVNTRPYGSYHHKCFRRLECFRTRVATERSPVVPDRLLPFARWRGLLFVFRGRLSAILEGQVPFVSRCQLLIVLKDFNSYSQIPREAKGTHQMIP